MDNGWKSNIKASTADHTKNPLKKVHSVANKFFVVIDEDIAKHLKISEYDSWFEQIQIDDGILLKKHDSTSSTTATATTNYSIIDAMDAGT